MSRKSLAAYAREVLTDAHIHFADLLERDPGFPERFARAGILACAASHAEEEFRRTETLRARGLVFAASFGIHPQWAVMDHAAFLETVAREGRIAAVGEAGFDFFGDRPERLRSPENEAAQGAAFELQLELAERYSLPLLLHVRRGMDLVFKYSRRLSRLPAAVFHSYAGTAGEAKAFLRRGVPAWFSFGAAILNGHKRAQEAAREVPEDRLLAETDAPWQPPRGSAFCPFEAIGDILRGLAALRGAAPEALEERVAANFLAAYPAAAALAPEIPRQAHASRETKT